MSRKPTRSLPASTDLASDLATIRDRIGALRGKLAEVSKAPIHSSEQEENIRRFVATAEARAREAYAPELLTSFPAQEPNLSFAFATDMTGGFAIVLGAEAVVSFMLRDALATNPSGVALTAAQKEAETDRLDRELLAAEVDEEATIRSAEDSGIIMARRADARAELILAETLENIA